MSWPMPPSGPWNPGVPPMAPGDMGGYTPEQWAVMQQQNWLQWSQWQQQYAQWQNEYGEKYAQQMQALQAMGGMPPLPTNTAPPAPPPGPPPEQPPPPPPHENNQPLYEQKLNQPVPVPPPNSQQNHITNVQDNTHNRSDSTVASVNSEALKKLAEEERLFDIQFKKWEEEIDKWRKENVNHPDKQAYFDYEQKFEACRVQLLERRQQMKQKRARLLSNTPQAANIPATVKISTAIPPPLLETPTSQNFPLQNYTTKPPPPQIEQNQNIQYQQHPNANLQYDQPNNMPYQNSRNSDFQKSNEQFQQPRNYSRFEQSNNNQQFEARPRNSNDSQFQQIKNTPGQHQIGFSWKKDKNSNQNSDFGFDNDVKNLDQLSENYADENYESYQNADSKYSTNSNFLPTSASAKGIPGLDLVPDDKPTTVPHEVIDITDDPAAEQSMPKQSQLQIPDYSKISKGINNILGDEKIMNILTMVRDQNIPFQNDTKNKNTQYFGANNNRNSQLNSQWKDDTHNNQQFEKRHMPQNRPPAAHGALQSDWQQNPQREQDSQWQKNRQREDSEREGNPQWEQNSHWENKPQWEQNTNWESNRQWQQNSQWEQNSDYSRNMHNNRQNNMPQEPNYDRNSQNVGQNMAPRPNLPSVDPIRPLMQDQRHTPPSGGSIRPLMQDLRPTAAPGPIRPLMQDIIRPIPPPGGPNRPPLQDVSAQQNMFSGESQENKGFGESNLNQPQKPKWIEVPLFNPSIIVEYEHQSLRLKARDFIEPVHMFDYNHKSKDDEYKKIDFEREADELFSRKPRRAENDDSRLASDWMGRDLPSKDFERRIPRDDFRDEGRSRMGQREYENRSRDIDNRSRDYENRPWDHEERRRPDDKYDERRRDERDKFSWREDIYRSRDRERDRGDRERDRGNREKERDRDRDLTRDRGRDYKRDDSRNRSISNERDSRKRGISKETDVSDKSASKKIKGNESPKLTAKTEAPKHIVMVDDILESPGRDMRPQKIVIILRGPPGSGKSYLAKLIRDREAQFGGTVRIMSIDDYFMQEGEVEEKDPVTGKMVKKPSLKYEFEDSLEETYITSLKRAFKRTITDGYFTFLIYDAVNDQLKSYADIWNFARQNGFQVYICTMDLDAQTCFKRNIHGRTMDDIQIICSRFFPTPAHHIQLDPTTLLQSASITEVHMEDASDEVIMEDVQEIEVEHTSKWEKMDDESQLARLDGTSKPLRPSQLSMEDYLQLDDWKPTTAKPGKKTVRWADIEERREQEKMRAIGFVVGQTDWNRMTDPTLGSSALTQTKYIERVKRF